MNYTSRSAMETADRCLRRRLYEYHWNGTGIVPSGFNVDMEIGSAVHEGLGSILLAMQDPKTFLDEDGVMLTSRVTDAVDDALDYFNEVLQRCGADKSEDETYQYQIAEAKALIEAFVYGWGIYRAESFYHEYEVLDVEREELYQLTDSILLQGKVDAIVLHRATGDVKLISWKTIKEYTERTEKAAQHDNQGISETLVAEKGLELGISNTELVLNAFAFGGRDSEVVPTADIVKLANKLRALMGCEPLRWAPTSTVSSVLMGYFLKGEKARDSKAPEGVSRYIYSSPLIRGWRKWNEAVQEWEYAWCYNPPSDTTKSGKSRLGKGWERFDAWSEFEGGVQAWLNLLMETTDEGYLVVQPEAGEAIKQQLVEVEFCRNEREIASWLRQRQASELRIFGGVNWLYDIEAPVTETEKLDELIDTWFPQTRSSCHYPTDCPYIPACFDPEVHENPSVATDQYGDALYQIRVPHHEAEREALALQTRMELGPDGTDSLEVLE